MSVQKVMSQRSTGSCTRCTHANAFPVLGLILRKMITNCESIFINEQYIIMSSYSFLLYTKLTSIHYVVVLGYDFICIKNWEEWMKAFSIWHKGSFVFFCFPYDRPQFAIYLYFFVLFFEFFLNQYDSKLRIK